MQTPTISHLCHIALQVTGRPVRWHRGGPKGAWLTTRHQISIRHGMSDNQTRSTLAHELSHAVRGDLCGYNQAVEDRADRDAADFLIRPTDYATAERQFGADTTRIADELGVTSDVVDTWRVLMIKRREAS